MLGQFIESNRDEILARARARVAARPAHPKTEHEATTGVPFFLDQLVHRLEKASTRNSDAGVAATEHGREMLREGFSVAEVVLGYGDVCQVVTELALEKGSRIGTEEFRRFNELLDAATADAVSGFQHQRDRATARDETERLGTLAHELRNQLNTAFMAFDVLKRGTVGVGGSTGALLGRSLLRLRETIDRSLAEVRMEAGLHGRERVRVADLIDDVGVGASFAAREARVALTMDRGEGGASVDVDRHIVESALGNLLQNAFKFTLEGRGVTLRTRASASQVTLEVEDGCGGLPPGGTAALFEPYVQRGTDRTGLGLGLVISRRGVEAMGGTLEVRDLPGKGCIFTIALPTAHPVATPTTAARDATDGADGAVEPGVPAPPLAGAD